MAKLNHLKIKNYRSIRDSDLHLSEKINVFIGSTDSGKSNIVRAIRDLVFNAAGNDFITHGEKKCMMVLDGVTWEKGGGINQYRTDEGMFKNIGRKSPDEVRKQLKIDEIEWDSSASKKIQFIEQFEPKYILAYNDSLVARILGKISGIHRIFQGNKSLLRDKKQLTTKKKYVQEEIEKTEKELEQFEDLDKLEKLISKIENKVNRCLKLCDEKDALLVLDEETYDAVQRYKTAKELVEDIEIDSSLVDKLEAIESERMQLMENQLTVMAIQDSVKDLEETIEEQEVTKNALEKELEAKIKDSNICPLTNKNYYDTCQKDILLNA